MKCPIPLQRWWSKWRVWWYIRWWMTKTIFLSTNSNQKFRRDPNRRDTIQWLCDTTWHNRTTSRYWYIYDIIIKSQGYVFTVRHNKVLCKRGYMTISTGVNTIEKLYPEISRHFPKTKYRNRLKPTQPALFRYMFSIFSLWYFVTMWIIGMHIQTWSAL